MKPIAKLRLTTKTMGLTIMMLSRRHLAALVVACAVALAAFPAAAAHSFEALFAPGADLWERWTAHDPDAAARIDHRTWDRFIKTYVSDGGDGVNRVAYGRVTDADKRALEDYIAGLAATPIRRYSRAEQFAYWINLYNALTMNVVLDHYPVDGIRDIDISPGLFADGPWGRKLVEIEGESVSINDIEHRILRPIWGDPRIHYAVNCASISCPNLQPTAFTAANADALLTAAARAYVNHPRGARIEDGRLVVSSLYEWYQEDFGGDDAGVISQLRQYADPGLRSRLARIGRIGDHAYDWGLNDAVGVASGRVSGAQ